MKTPRQQQSFVKSISLLAVLGLSYFLLGVSGCSLDPKVFCADGYLKSTDEQECVRYCKANFKDQQTGWCTMGQFLFLTQKINSVEKKTIDEMEAQGRQACDAFVDSNAEQIKSEKAVQAAKSACVAGIDSEKTRTLFERRSTAQGAERETGNNR